MSLEAGIWASGLGFGSRDCDLSLEARIRFGGRWLERTEEKKKKEKIPDMCESIAHQPLRGRCPKGDFEYMMKMAS